MVSVDTNLIIRLLTGDEAEQAAHARRVFDVEQVFIAQTVILETEWVLRYSYGFSPEAIVHAFHRLFGLPNVQINHAPALYQSLQWHLDGMDFGDALHLSLSQHAQRLLTFDRQFVQRAAGNGTCPVEHP